MIENQPLVSVFMMTYNHEAFIRQALDGVLMQKTTFDFDIVVGEDCSTDNTRAILLEYQQKYPEKFKLLLHEKNIGAMANQMAVLQACTGKYIALCEGDDYWTDPYKLQKQVDFLEANEDCSFCYTNAEVLDGNTNLFIGNFIKDNRNNRLNTHYYLKNSIYIPTLTVVFKKDKIDFNDLLSFRNIYYGDIILFSLLLENGDGYFINETTAVYRSSVGIISKQTVKSGLYNGINAIKALNTFFNYKYYKYYKKALSPFYLHLFFYYLRRFKIFLALKFFFLMLFSNIIISKNEWIRAYYNCYKSK